MSEVRQVFNFIAGGKRPGVSTFEKVSPVDGRLIALVHEADRQIVRDAVGSGYLAMKGPWGRSSPEERAQILFRAAEIVSSRSRELAALEAEEIGRPVLQVQGGHVARTIEVLRLYAEELLSSRQSAYPGRAIGPGVSLSTASEVITYTLRKPRGVVGIISPWNVPILLLAINLAPALAAGNAVVIKPSEEAPSSAVALAEILVEAGLPTGAISVVQGFGANSAGEFLTSDERIAAFGFTGEPSTGSAIMRAAAEGLREVLLELGGKNPAIIFADADLSAAIAAIARAAFTNTGQVCLCMERVYVERSVFDQVVAGVAEAAKKLRLGAPDDPAADIGPVIGRKHQARVMGYIQRAIVDGAQVRAGGTVPVFGDRRDSGAFVTPTVLTGLPETAEFNREEVFGPVVHLAPFDTEEQAVKLANDSPSGLAAMTWTKDLSRAHRVSGRINAGISWVNCWQLRDLRTPLEGHGRSGVGIQGARESLDFYSALQTVTIQL